MRYLIGIGNYTALDDSIGIRIVEAIAQARLESGFRAIELAGNLVDLIHYLDEETSDVLLVDAARMGRAPGDFAFFTPEDVEGRRELAGFSTHEADLLAVLRLARSLGRPLPAITILGIEPEAFGAGMGVSPTLARRLPEYVAAAVDFFDRSKRTPSP